ncbi:MAG: response regulator [Thermodesulfovibrionales bacterium]|nr:response regulator [Thermodesulfovibrionales bacterium]
MSLFKNKPIVFKIIFPIILAFILIGVTLFYFNLKSISDFAEEIIKNDVKNYEYDIYSLCDKNLNNLLNEKKADDQISLTIAKANTINSIEAYAKEKEIEVFISSPYTEILKTSLFEEISLDKDKVTEKKILTWYLNNKRYFVYLFSFEPWQWRILLAIAPDKYSNIENKVLLSYMISCFIFFVSLFFIISSLNKSIKEPLVSIVNSLNKNIPPSYEGTKEIEFLSNSIRAMLNSLERRIRELEYKEKEIIKEKEFAESILNSISDPICIIEAESLKIISANEAFKEKFKIKNAESLIGIPCYSILHNRSESCPECPIDSFLREGKAFTYETKIYDKYHKHVTFEVSISSFVDKLSNITYIILVQRDITERKRLEEQLIQSQKLESIGILAGGIAHDFNNILTAITGYANLLYLKVEQDPILKKYVEQILKSSDRAVKLISSLLAFSRKQIINPIPIDINEIIMQSIKLLRSLLEENIEIKTNLSHEKLLIMADPVQLEQVFMNLATNSRDAMPKGGTFLIETNKSNIDENYIAMYGYGKVGQYAKISVTDTGTGIDPKIINDIFNPFFTTKEVGKGTGLGLSMVYGIIKQQNGFIDVQSEKGIGTTFNIYLPLINSVVSETKVQEKPKYDNKIDLTGTESILIVEDERLVRESHKELLLNYGYKTFEASDGEEALNLFLNHIEEIDLILCDVVMPKKNGMELAKDIINHKKNIKILLMSGYSIDLREKQDLLNDNINFISKPVSGENLLKKIRQLLDNNISTFKT